MVIKATIRRLLGLRVRTPRPDILETAAALSEELNEIERRRAAAGLGNNQSAYASGETPEHRAIGLNLTALCLSGALAADTRFEISYPASSKPGPLTGRAFIMITRTSDREPRLEIGRLSRC